MIGFSNYWDVMAIDPSLERALIAQAGGRHGHFYPNLWSAMYETSCETDPSEPGQKPNQAADSYGPHARSEGEWPDRDYSPWEPAFMAEAVRTYTMWLKASRESHDRLKNGELPDVDTECTLRDRVVYLEGLIDSWDDDAYQRYGKLHPESDPQPEPGPEPETKGCYAFSRNGIHDLGAVHAPKYNFPVVVGLEHWQGPESWRSAAGHAYQRAGEKILCRLRDEGALEQRSDLSEKLEANTLAIKRAIERLELLERPKTDLDLGKPKAEPLGYARQEPVIFQRLRLEHPYHTFMITSVAGGEPEPEPEDEAAIREYNRKIMLGSG